MPGSRHIALAHSDVSSSKDLFSIFSNPAGIYGIDQREFGLFYSPALFGVKELSNAFAAFIEPTKFGSFSAGFMIYGYELYKETKIAIGFTKNISDNFFFGLTSLYHNISIARYGTNGKLIFNAGGIFRLTDNFNLGFSIKNILKTSFADHNIPTVFSLGVGYSVTNELNIFSSVNKEINYKPSIKFGAEYSLIDFLQIRIGTANEPDIFSGGIGISYDFFQFNYAISSHSDLGPTHQFDIKIRFNK
jgi:hypothetical protein